MYEFIYLGRQKLKIKGFLYIFLFWSWYLNEIDSKNYKNQMKNKIKLKLSFVCWKKKQQQFMRIFRRMQAPEILLTMRIYAPEVLTLFNIIQSSPD